MSPILSESAQKTPTEELVGGYLYANKFLPQMDAAVTIIPGGIAVGMVLDHRITWDDIPSLRPNESQVDQIIEAAKFYHELNKVPCHFSDKEAKTAADALDRYAYTRQRMGNVSMAWIPSVNITAANYAMGMLPLEMPPIPSKFMDADGTMSRRGQKEVVDRSRRLFRPDQEIGAYRPETVALGSLFSVARGALDTIEAKKIALHHRKVITSNVMTTTKYDIGRQSLATAADLRPIVLEHLTAALPDIYARTGVVIPESVILKFMIDTELDQRALISR